MPTPIPTRDHRPRAVTAQGLEHRHREAFSTALFTGLNIAVFLVLAASVVGAAFLYSQGA
jgi:hypothetical protein